MISRYEILAEVVEEGSFTRAAEKLKYTQPAVSQAVSSIEKEFGTMLVTRGKDGVHLTADGRDLFPYIRSLVTAERQLEDKKRRMAGFTDSVITIGTFTSVSRVVLPQLMASFHQKYPQVKFVLRQGEYDNIYTWIKDGTVDFGFLGRHDVTDLDMDPLYEDTMAAVLPHDHPLAAAKRIPLEKLCRDPFILLDEGRYSIPSAVYEKAHLHLNIAYKIYDDYTILAMIRQKMGISILYRLVVSGFADDLIVRPLTPEISRTIYLACLHYRTMSASARAFYDFIKQEAPDIVKRTLSF